MRVLHFHLTHSGFNPSANVTLPGFPPAGNSTTAPFTTGHLHHQPPPPFTTATMRSTYFSPSLATTDPHHYSNAQPQQVSLVLANAHNPAPISGSVSSPPVQFLPSHCSAVVDPRFLANPPNNASSAGVRPPQFNSSSDPAQQLLLGTVSPNVVGGAFNRDSTSEFAPPNTYELSSVVTANSSADGYTQLGAQNTATTAPAASTVSTTTTVL